MVIQIDIYMYMYICANHANLGGPENARRQYTHIYIYIQYININTDIKIYVYMVAPPPQSYFEKRMGRLFHLSSPDTVQKHGKYHFLWNMMRHSLSLRSSVPSFVHRKTKHVTKNIQKRKARIRFSIFTSGKQC